MGTTIATNTSLSAPLAIIALDNDVEEVRTKELGLIEGIMKAIHALQKNTGLLLF